MIHLFVICLNCLINFGDCIQNAIVHPPGVIFETPNDEVKRISKMIVEEMSSVVNSDQYSFSIPFTVDLNTGDNWGALH